MSTPAPWFDWEAGEWLHDPKTLLANYEDACLIAASPLFKEACLGTAAPGESTPLDALQHLMDAFLLGDRLPAAEWEAVERLARELRVAVEKAEGEGS